LAGFLSAVANETVAGDGNSPGFDVAKGIGAAVQWGAIAVTQPSSGLENLDHMPPSIVSNAPDRSERLEEPAVFHPNH
jgi:1-phosphofructokinase